MLKTIYETDGNGFVRDALCYDAECLLVIHELSCCAMFLCRQYT